MARCSLTLDGKYSDLWRLPCVPGMLCHFAPSGLAASLGVEISCLQRPSIRAGINARHPILYASFDESRKACRRRPHLYDGFLQGPENARAASTSTQIEGYSAPQYRLGLFKHRPRG